MHDLNLLRPLAQYSWNWKIIFKDWMHHCDPKLGVIRVHGWYFCSYTLLKHTCASCKIFCRLGDCKMHQNDLKCGDLVDFVASQSHFALWKWFFFGGGGGDLGLFWASCSEDQNMGSNEVKLKWIIWPLIPSITCIYIYITLNVLWIHKNVQIVWCHLAAILEFCL